MKARVSEQQIKDALDGIVAPKNIQNITFKDKKSVSVIVEVDPAQGAALEPMRLKAENALSIIKGIKQASVILTAQTAPQDQSDQSGKQSSGCGGDKTARQKPQHIPGLLPDVKKIIAVASGKGGVGKSTVTSNLAICMAGQGMKVGILDADIYGPSQPRMMGLEGQKPGGEEGKINPLTAYGVKVMSIGFMVDQNAPLIWRGPMVQSALVQLMRDVDWGELDVLLVDMPPGTGDAQLTMAQKVPLTGAIIVSTPQDIALIDARKAINMFEQVDVPILGIVENMSAHICTNCGHEEHIFGHGGAEQEAEQLGKPFLGAVPLHKDIRLASDQGNQNRDITSYYEHVTRQLTHSFS